MVPLGQVTAVGGSVWIAVAVAVLVGAVVAVELGVSVGEGASVGLAVAVGEGVAVGPPGPQAAASRQIVASVSAVLRFIKSSSRP